MAECELNSKSNCMANILEQLKELKSIKPRKDWVAAEREVLMSQITRQGTVKPQSFYVNGWYLFKSLLPGSLLRFAARPLGALCVIAVFIFSTGIFGVNASKGSLPGDLLYSVKRTSEKVKVGMTVAEEDKVKLHMDFAEERVNEIEAVSGQDNKPQKKQQQIKVAAEGLQEEMKKTQQTLEKVKQEPKRVEKIVAAVKIVDKKAEELGDRIAQQKQGLDPTQVEVSKSLDKAKDATDETAVKAVEVIIDKHEKGGIKMAESELVETINKKITKAQEKIKQVETQIAEANVAVQESEKAAAVKSANDKAATAGAENTAADNAVSPAGTAVTDPANPTASVATEAATENTGQPTSQSIAADIKDMPGQAEQKLTEAKDFLDHGDLSSAIEKIKESSTITNEVKVGVETISQNIENAAAAIPASAQTATPAAGTGSVTPEGAVTEVK